MRRPRFLLAIALFSVSTSSIFARFLPDVPAVVIGVWRMLFAAGLLWLFSGFRRMGKLSYSAYGYIVLAGVFLGIHFACFFGALKFTSVAAATFLSTTAPVFTVIIEYVFLKRPAKAHVLIGVFLALFGALAIQFSFLSGFSEYMVGNALGIAASICMALVLMLAEKIRETEAALASSRMMYLIAGLVLIPVALFLNQPLFSYSMSEYRWLLLLGLIPTVIGHTS
ncbi:MAG: EamA family transporter, partial [Actinobacteria bacterium]|nr:EamA family transporter [Actinomycetota bacterium]